eukprot:7980122-Pyramimonas_sp.AAC.1
MERDACEEAFGGAPYGATKRARGVPKWVWGPHASTATAARTRGDSPCCTSARISTQEDQNHARASRALRF